MEGDVEKLGQLPAAFGDVPSRIGCGGKDSGFGGCFVAGGRIYFLRWQKAGSCERFIFFPVSLIFFIIPSKGLFVFKYNRLRVF